MRRSSLVIIAACCLVVSTAAGQKTDEIPKERVTWVELDPAVTDRPGFKTWGHPPPDRLAHACSWAVSLAQWKQDVLDARAAPAHFDNCTFTESLAFIAKCLKECDEAVRPGRYEQAMFALGKALHTLQDFYSHSNYLELMALRHPTDFLAIPKLPLWTDDAEGLLTSLRSEGLITGVVDYEKPNLCAANAPPHNKMNKDSQSSTQRAGETVAGWQNRTFYRAAYLQAEMATNDFLSYAFRRWPELAKRCASPVGYITLVDRRRP